MWRFRTKSKSARSLQHLPLETTDTRFALDRLRTGVDNVRFDVRLSPLFSDTIENIVFQMLSRHAGIADTLDADERGLWPQRREEFEWFFGDLMLAALHKAKLVREVQFDFLAQASVVKVLIEVIRAQFEILVKHFSEFIQDYEQTHSHDISGIIQLKEDFSRIRNERQRLLRNVGNELFHYLADVQRKDLKEMREINFGAENLLPEVFFTNPILHVENPFDDFFQVEQYVILGHQHEAQQFYEQILDLLKTFLRRFPLAPTTTSQPVKAATDSGNAVVDGNQDAQSADISPVDGWLQHPRNADILFNCFKTESQLRALKIEKKGSKLLSELKPRFDQQRNFLNTVYHQFQKQGLLERMLAAREVKALYTRFCPPLVPAQLLDYLIIPSKRKAIINQLERLKGFYGKSYSFKLLNKRCQQLKRIPTKQKKTYLLEALKTFFTLHRDYENYRLLSKAIESINIVSDEKIINLSRANHTLHEFLLPQEIVLEEKPIINHVVIKADVRGSTGITRRMKERFLNPASFFSLNFFDPITKILPEFGADKVFIEGDAVILSIFEREDTPEEWYSIAMACGLAIKIIRIVQRYNVKSREKRLPNLELGIGICYHNSAPTFLFDGEDRIMISPAINTADRLSGCNKIIRQKMERQRWPFNIHVLETAMRDGVGSPEAALVRYNVNGIELNAEGLEKLSREIKLKVLELRLPSFKEKTIKLYTGKYPTAKGRYQRLVIREAHIPRVEPLSLKIKELTSRKYYEVCTHPMLYEYAKKAR